ncbi:MAG TPA: DUF1697 domain-containing protein [Steroidobacteraceae bacterium]|nr:DUF1697 domain-containing protein [Steroidobacteraceae bacterium]
MPTFVALLRGVNVGAAKRVPMEELRRLLAARGYTRIATVLNSGNAVFDAAGGTAASHAATVAAAIGDGLGIEVPVVVKSARELAAIVAGNPLCGAGVDPSRLLVAFARDRRTLLDLAAIAPLVAARERFFLGPRAAYLSCPAGILESPAWEALLGRSRSVVTTRNWATVLKLQSLASSADAGPGASRR